jgi:hypothetical protein
LKYYPFIKNLIIGIYIVFFLPAGWAQNTDLHILDSLPTNFTYHVDIDSFAEMGRSINQPPIVYFKGKKKIGCYQPVEVQPVFSLSIGHQFLFEDFKDYSLLKAGKKTSHFRIILYAVKKQHNEQDSLLINALAEYCIYGQSNYVTQSKDYILFTYLFAGHAEMLIDRFRKMGFWDLIEGQLIKNLNTGGSIQAKTLFPQKVNNPFHKEELIKGKYLWVKEKLPFNTQSSKTHTYLRLKNHRKATIITNYNQPKSNHFKYKGQWYMDDVYLYIYHPNYSYNGLRVFRMHDENTLMHISGKYGFLRVKD